MYHSLYFTLSPLSLLSLTNKAHSLQKKKKHSTFLFMSETQKCSPPTMAHHRLKESQTTRIWWPRSWSVYPSSLSFVSNAFQSIGFPWSPALISVTTTTKTKTTTTTNPLLSPPSSSAGTHHSSNLFLSNPLKLPPPLLPSPLSISSTKTALQISRFYTLATACSCAVVSKKKTTSLTKTNTIVTTCVISQPNNPQRFLVLVVLVPTNPFWYLVLL